MLHRVLRKFPILRMLGMRKARLILLNINIAMRHLDRLHLPHAPAPPPLDATRRTTIEALRLSLPPCPPQAANNIEMDLSLRPSHIGQSHEEPAAMGF